MSITVQSSPETPLFLEMSTVFAVNFKAILGASLLLSLSGIVDILTRAAEFLSEKEEKPLVPPELP